MGAIRQLGRKFFSTLPSRPRVAHVVGFDLLDPTMRWEEERMPAYSKGLYYPIRLGGVYSSRYHVLSKLGFGANSTVWFCRDLNIVIALKVYIHSAQPTREVEVLSRLSTLNSSHPGSAVIRTMLDTFDMDGPKGKHQCIVHEPLLTSLLHFQATFNPPRLNEDLVRGAVQQLLSALNFLHTEAHIIHTDIQAKNIIIGTTDSTVFEEWDEEEEAEPSARKVGDDNVIYKSRPFYQKGNLRRFGLPILSDFGEARIGDQHHGIIQPDIYRAPEVTLGMEWTSKVDIWNVGVLIWDLLEGRHLFDARTPDGNYSDTQHLAEIIAVLGPPPFPFLQGSSKCEEYWDEKGIWKGSAEVQKRLLEDSGSSLTIKNEASMRFLRKMLQWDPDKRQSAHELLSDPWLNP